MLTPAALPASAMNSAPAAAASGSKHAEDETVEEENDVDMVGHTIHACPTFQLLFKCCAPATSNLHGCKSMHVDSPALSRRICWQVCTETLAVTAGPLPL